MARVQVLVAVAMIAIGLLMFLWPAAPAPREPLPLFDVPGRGMGGEW